MSNNPVLSNSLFANNPDISPRSTEVTNGGKKCQVQHLILTTPGATPADSDIPIGPLNPLNVTGSLSISAGSVATVNNESVANVGTTSVPILAAFPTRTRANVKSRMSNTVNCYISLSGTALTTKPTLLEPGESLPIMPGYTGVVSAITATGTVDLEIVEI